MLNLYGLEGPTWDMAKEQATSVLIKIAGRRGSISYSELVSQISALCLEPHDSRLFHLLGEISSEEDAAGRGMLTAIVVHKSGDMQPGPGFFELARLLGRNIDDPLSCWISEFNRVHDVWAKAR